MSSDVRILVTGSEGFVGRHVVSEVLQRGHHVVGIGRSPQGASRAGYSYRSCDLFDSKAVEALLDEVQPTHLLHLAWQSEHGALWQSSDNLNWICVTFHLAKAFRERGGIRFVGSGTCAEYDWGGEAPLGEDSAPGTAYLYGVAKRAVFDVLSRYFANESVALAWGRLFFLYGPGEKRERLVPSILEGLIAGRDVQMTSGDQIRDYLYIKDAARALVDLLLRDDVRGVVNIASGKPQSVLEVARAVACRVGGLGHLQVGSLAQRAGEARYIVADVSRLRESLGFCPQYRFEQGVEEMIAWLSTAKGGGQVEGSRDERSCQ